MNWTDRACVIIASGPSAVEDDLSVIRCPVIVVNNSWRLYPSADVLFAGDRVWWDRYGDDAKSFRGRKVCHDSYAARRHGIESVECNKGAYFLMDAPRIGFGGNSGFQALNLAVNWGCRRIALVGFDMHLNDGAHWHEDHPRGMLNPTPSGVRKWKSGFERAAAQLRGKVDVFNCNPQSGLRCFPFARLKDVAIDHSTDADRRTA